jgi:hypothetical protein
MFSFATGHFLSLKGKTFKSKKGSLNISILLKSYWRRNSLNAWLSNQGKNKTSTESKNYIDRQGAVEPTAKRNISL